MATKKQQTAGVIAEQYCKNDRHSPTLTLAKKLYSENSKLFSGLASARSAIRLYRGEFKHRRPNEGSVWPQLSPKSLVVSSVHSPKAMPTNAKILLLDIETAPLKSYTWGIWNQNIYPMDQIISDWFVLCWSAKWLFQKKVTSGKLNHEELASEDDSRIMTDMWRLIEQADIVITHNGDKFDLAKLNTRFLIQGLKPTMPYQSIDTLKVVKHKFAFTSNKLDYICMKLGLRRKTDTGGFDLWKRCANNDMSALKEMAKYCDNDVLCLEELYLYIRPWINNHPNMGLFITEDNCSCPNCGGLDLTDTGGKYRTQVSEYTAVRCDNCGAIGRARKAWNTGLNKNLTVSIAR